MRDDPRRPLRRPRRPGPHVTRRDFFRAAAGGLVLPHLWACAEEDPVRLVGGGDPRLTERPRTPTLAAPVGETRLGLGGGRDGLLYVPPGYDPATPAPFFVALHGTPGDASLWQPFYAACDARGMIMLAVESRGFGWDLIESGSFDVDPRFIDEALGFAFDRCAVDPEHVALLGFSDGASYALSLGVSNGDLFTRLVAFSPGFIEPGSPIVGRPGIFVSHGTADAVLPVTASRVEIVPFLRAAGYEVTYEEFAGGHEVPQPVASLAFDFITP